MTQRNPIVVLLLSFVTGGLYQLFWMVSTKDEMVERGADIPTAWLILVPFLNIVWAWKWCKGVEHVTAGDSSAVLSLLLLVALGPIGAAVIQSSFNKRALPAAAAA